MQAQALARGGVQGYVVVEDLTGQSGGGIQAGLDLAVVADILTRTGGSGHIGHGAAVCEDATVRRDKRGRIDKAGTRRGRDLETIGAKVVDRRHLKDKGVATVGIGRHRCTSVGIEAIDTGVAKELC